MESKDWGGEIMRNVWTVRVVKMWNGLPDSIKEQETVNGFKNKIDNFFGLEGQKKGRVQKEQ